MFKKIILYASYTIVLYVSSMNAADCFFDCNEGISEEITPAELQRQLCIGTCLDTVLLQVAESRHFNPHKKKDALTTLLEQKASVDAEDENEHTVLYNVIHCAGTHKRADDTLIQFLIDKRAPLNGGNAGRCFPLEQALTFRTYSILEMLVKAGADVNNTQWSHNSLIHVLTVAAMTDQDACTAFDILAQGNLKDIDATPYVEGQTPIRCTPVCMAYTLDNYKPQLISRFFAHGANPWCPAAGCSSSPELFAENDIAAHEQWKSDAAQAVMKYIPVKPLAGMVMDYCIWPFKK